MKFRTNKDCMFFWSTIFTWIDLPLLIDKLNFIIHITKEFIIFWILSQYLIKIVKLNN